MSEWWTYTLSDFLMFAPRTYTRLAELYNRDLWPLHALALSLGIAALLLASDGKRWKGRAVSAILPAAWAFVAWAFHHQRYATINWVADYFAIAFAMQAVLMLMVGVVAGKLMFRYSSHPVACFGLAIALFGVLAYPMGSIVEGRGIASSEVFGVMPDPTVLTTLGLLLLVPGRTTWLLLVIPLLWCAVSGATLWTMGAAEGPVMIGFGALALVMRLWKVRGRG